MAQDNVKLHRRVVEAFNERDVGGIVALCDPRIELRSAVTASIYEGHGGVRRWHQDLEEAFGGQVWIEPTSYFDLGEHTITFHLLHGRGRQSGADIAERFAHVHRWRNGLTVWFKAYAHPEDAFRELGVAKDAAEQIAP